VRKLGRLRHFGRSLREALALAGPGMFLALRAIDVAVEVACTVMRPDAEGRFTDVDIRNRRPAIAAKLAPPSGAWQSRAAMVVGSPPAGAMEHREGPG